MNRKGLCQTMLLLAVILGIFSLLLITEPHIFSPGSNTSGGLKLQPNFQLDLARQNMGFPGEFMLAANLVPVVNYFCDALKQVNISGGKINNYKVIGNTLRINLVSLVIFMFYLFYRNFRNTEEDHECMELGFDKAKCAVLFQQG